MANSVAMQHNGVYKKSLNNGLVVLVIPRNHLPKVSIQLWYNVGSKDEKTGQRGLAHLIEHMIFKGTNTLSESDINLLTHKLSGYCNAYTSHDYTGYLFDLPSQHWVQAFPVMADCMRNCTFKEEFLSSELKAVIQELKMYNDDYTSTLIERMVCAIFPDHPYHYPIIGYKQDLWNVKREALVEFYAYHYVPNNATLVVVGDVRVDDVFAQAERYFGHIEPNPEYTKQEFHHLIDIGATTTTLYRDIQQPSFFLAWVIPGSSARKDYALDLVSWVIGSGKGSRLYALLVDELDLATHLESFVYDLFEHGLFFIHIQPKSLADKDVIIALINKELEKLALEHVGTHELQRAIKKTEVDFLTLQENNQKQAYLLGKYYLATGSADYLMHYCDAHGLDLKEEIRVIVASYLRPTVMHQGHLLALPEAEKQTWLALQEQSDKEDTRVLSAIVRDAVVEEGVYVSTITAEEPLHFNFAEPEMCMLSNDIKLIYHHTPLIPKIDIVIDFEKKHFYDPEDKQGLAMFVADMLQEGTENYTAAQLAQEFERYGMQFAAFPGQISLSLLSEDLEKGLALLFEILTCSLFDKKAIEKVRARILTEIAHFWDAPSQFISQLAREKIYENHPYRKNLFGTVESVNSITQKDLIEAYRASITPSNTRIAIVGDLYGGLRSKDDFIALMQRIFGTWEGPKVTRLVFPELRPIQAAEIVYPINRDQIVLAYAGLSVGRKNPDFDKILIFDQIFSGGVLGSMSSRLFDLREKSGLFYTIGGSLLARVDEQPGMIFIKTIVSADRLAEADRSIKQVIDHAIDTVTDIELEEAKRAIINSLVDNFASNKQMAATFLFLDRFNFPFNYFNDRAQEIMRISKDEVIAAVRRVLSSDKLITLKAGRL